MLDKEKEKTRAGNERLTKLMDKINMKVKIRSVRLPVTHFRNIRTYKTICGKNYKVPKRKVTSRLNRVTCRGCLNNIRSLKWVKKTIERRNKTSKSPQEIIDAILNEVEKSSRFIKK